MAEETVDAIEQDLLLRELSREKERLGRRRAARGAATPAVQAAMSQGEPPQPVDGGGEAEEAPRMSRFMANRLRQQQRGPR